MKWRQALLNSLIFCNTLSHKSDKTWSAAAAIKRPNSGLCRGAKFNSLFLTFFCMVNVDNYTNKIIIALHKGCIDSVFMQSRTFVAILWRVEALPYTLPAYTPPPARNIFSLDLGESHKLFSSRLGGHLPPVATLTLMTVDVLEWLSLWLYT